SLLSIPNSCLEGVEMPIDEYLWLPCWGCIEPQDDVRAWLANCSDDDRANQRSPSGLPLGCCRIKTVGCGAGVGHNARRDVNAVACTHKRGHWPNVRSWGEPDMMAGMT